MFLVSILLADVSSRLAALHRFRFCMLSAHGENEVVWLICGLSTACTVYWTALCSAAYRVHLSADTKYISDVAEEALIEANTDRHNML